MGTEMDEDHYYICRWSCAPSLQSWRLVSFEVAAETSSSCSCLCTVALLAGSLIGGVAQTGITVRICTIGARPWAAAWYPPALILLGIAGIELAPAEAQGWGMGLKGLVLIWVCKGNALQWGGKGVIFELHSSIQWFSNGACDELLISTGRYLLDEWKPWLMLVFSFEEDVSGELALVGIVSNILEPVR